MASCRRQYRGPARHVCFCKIFIVDITVFHKPTLVVGYREETRRRRITVTSSFNEIYTDQLGNWVEGGDATPPVSTLFYTAETLSKNRFRQPMQPGGRVRQPYSYSGVWTEIDDVNGFYSTLNIWCIFSFSPRLSKQHTRKPFFDES